MISTSFLYLSWPPRHGQFSDQERHFEITSVPVHLAHVYEIALVRGVFRRHSSRISYLVAVSCFKCEASFIRCFYCYSTHMDLDVKQTSCSVEFPGVACTAKEALPHSRYRRWCIGCSEHLTLPGAFKRRDVSTKWDSTSCSDSVCFEIQT